jgi:N4-gp56 family major capsid protein
MSVQQRTGFASDKVLAVYDRRMLERAKQNQIFDVGAQQRVIPAGSNTKKGFAFRYKGMLPATTPIAEYNGTNIKNANKVVREEVEFTVAHYGDYLVFTDELNLYDFDNIQSSFLDLLSDQASLTVDTIRRNTLRGGSNVVYADW